jgi:hypothetical protein
MKGKAFASFQKKIRPSVIRHGASMRSVMPVTGVLSVLLGGAEWPVMEIFMAVAAWCVRLLLKLFLPQSFNNPESRALDLGFGATTRIICRSAAVAQDLDLLLPAQHGGDHGSEPLLFDNLLSDLHQGTSEVALLSSHASRHPHHLCLPPQLRGRNTGFDGRLIFLSWCHRAFGALLDCFGDQEPFLLGAPSLHPGNGRRNL